MTLVLSQPDLESACKKLRTAPFVCVDTEFLREKTYFPKLCLIQLCAPDQQAIAIDPLATSFDWTPLYDVLFDPDILKVFHAGRQDLEIFFHMTGRVVSPLFDTQIAAMVCGYGEQAGYETVVRAVTGRQIDKGSQMTDWSRRPLTERQIGYALGDVVHLVDVYRALSQELESRGRLAWAAEEDALLQNPATYRITPEDSWKRIRIRSDKPRILSVLRSVAAWREREAERRDLPRGWVLRDETLAEIALHAPRTSADLARTRGMSEAQASGQTGKQILEAVRQGLETPAHEMPSETQRRDSLPPSCVPTLEMLRMLLKIACAHHQVAPKLVANADDLENLAMHDLPDIPALKGWRYDIFGADALALKRGEIALALCPEGIRKIHM